MKNKKTVRYTATLTEDSFEELREKILQACRSYFEL